MIVFASAVTPRHVLPFFPNLEVFAVTVFVFVSEIAHLKIWNLILIS